MSASPASPPAPARLVSLDAYRGFVMFLMVAEAFHLSRIAEAFPGNWFWQLVAFNTSHVEWYGCSLHDLIQPSFSFMVGVALPFSIASRVARGQTLSVMTLHAVWRSLVLIFLGVFLRSVGRQQTNFTFEDTLSQIGLGYTFLFLLGLRSVREQWAAFWFLMVGYWLAWALYPVPGPGFDYGAVGVPADWEYHATGFAAHWNKNSNLGWAFDRWFLNLWPREKEWLYNGGGYLTLSFIPTLGTMLLGSLCGQWLRGPQPAGEKLRRMVVAGLAGLALGTALHYAGICPLVKKIWTPTWTLFSGGCCFLLMAFFCGVIDMAGWKRWAFPLVVIGMNSIAIYCLSHLIDGFILDSFRIHLGAGFFNLLGPTWAPAVRGLCVVGTLWLILYWMYRRKLFLRI